jgi:nucleotide-binding universal stress UspA family protein
VCTDFSDNSEPARHLACEYAKAFGAGLLLVHVIDSFSSFPSYVDWVGDELEGILARLQQTAQTNLDALGKECGQVVSDVKTFCREGLPPQEIAKLAAEENVDLVVMGTHGRTGVRHLLMGSVARNVLRSVHRPVLIVESP